MIKGCQTKSQSRRRQTSSVEETRNLGRILGEVARPGIVVALTGELGSGKTAFAQGVARGAGVEDRWYVTSPSYTLINEYPGREMTLYHIDFYRLEDVAEAEELGVDEIVNDSGLVIIEWADKFDSHYWRESLEVRFSITGETKREIVFTARDDYGKRLLDGLEKMSNEA